MPSKKQLQTASLIKRNFGSVLFDEGMNIYGNALVTVTNVVVTPDLGMAKLYLSVYNADNKEEVLQRLVNHKSILKSNLVHRIKRHVRRIPDIDMYLDETMDEMYKVDSIFDRLYAENQMPSEEE